MESRVERVILGYDGKVSLDIRALTEYSGQGKCWNVDYEEYEGKARNRNIEQLRRWAQRINWPAVEVRGDKFINLKKYFNLIYKVQRKWNGSGKWG